MKTPALSDGGWTGFLPGGVPLNREIRSTRKLSSRIIKDIATLFHPAPNSPHNSFDLAKTIIKMAKDKSSAERQSKPSPDAILRRLHQIKESTARKKLDELNQHLLHHLQLPKKPIIALDFTIRPYYGEENPTLVSDPRLPGTNLGIKFAFLSVVERGKTFTLKVRQVNPLESETKILEEMLNYTRRLVEPRLILLDRGFYSVKAIKLLKSRKQSFIMPAKRTGPVKRLCEQFKNREIPPTVNYTVKSPSDGVLIKLTLVERETEKGVEIQPFISDREMGPEKISEIYGWRWRIETNNREFEKFKAFTTSRSMKIRRLYFLLSMILYNFWIITRGGSEYPRAYQFKKILKLTLKWISAEIGNISRPPPTP